MINVRIPAEINQNLKMVHFEILRQSLFLGCDGQSIFKQFHFEFRVFSTSRPVATPRLKCPGCPIYP